MISLGRGVFLDTLQSLLVLDMHGRDVLDPEFLSEHGISTLAAPFKMAIRKLKLHVALLPCLEAQVKYSWIVDYAQGLLEAMLDQEAQLRMFSRCATRIQRTWHACRSNPYHPLGFKRLMKEYSELELEFV
jgi:hypothetical protein